MPRKRQEKTGIGRTLASIQNRVDDARDDWIEKLDPWAFRYFNDMPIVLDELRKATKKRKAKRKREGADKGKKDGPLQAT